ncbi:alcohol dehydrogenase, propanol-preferring [Geosmithia morbida]|uniref:Alcohol dehydrogenase, propanol-preferring n=1 Tax=Geosmithia morbida TaxID=1094350 RepID=A0A9P4YWZ5_9HYPO|nr:alcohol dehydrogenase, propanol-preferring [Geosmithia morbida]KAF4124611.1 alcohol dehydrogenase, propanol-preferring [Geosmithia morbida]
MGHEAVGHVTRMHPSVAGKGFEVGDAIDWEYSVGCCFECDGCRVHNLYCSRGQTAVQGFSVDGYFKNNGLPSSAAAAWDSMRRSTYAKAMGIKVMGIDINDDALASVRGLSADITVNSATTADLVHQLRSVTGSSRGVHAAPHILRTGGVRMVIGMAPRDLQVSTYSLATGRYGIRGESSSTPQRMHKAVEFPAKHGIQPDVEFRTLEDLPQMADDMIHGRATRRQVVRFQKARKQWRFAKVE